VFNEINNRDIEKINIFVGMFDSWRVGEEEEERGRWKDFLATWVEWAFLLTGLCLEILSLAFDQASSQLYSFVKKYIAAGGVLRSSSGMWVIYMR
ncbi:hypothetical protein GBA52_024288, partial [Prunus armeniaca]